MSRALDDIAAERQRQIDAEGWGAAHDDLSCGNLAIAAACYALPVQRRSMMVDPDATEGVSLLSSLWPWSRQWWKPKDRRRDLVRAGALIVAEIERLDRLAERSAPR
ncbi:hypothetical protein [Rhodopseudomonas palustris]|uniref:hypothetical protein n=1 Tax=Rhodopseudomonas palustris TaxID=1076 RepID=UPI000CEC8A0F|nr:hypothetical protein [Rhodopseudomonas palustris]PPQ42129.1 hypothetical protein CKO39_18235 [Rhodopseudomonas palustris]